MQIIKSSEYKTVMDKTVLPYLKTRSHNGRFDTAPGQHLYYEYFSADHPVANVVLVHGYSEAIQKYQETVYYFLECGCNVWMMQNREHGFSFRSTKNPDLIHIESFQDMVDDLHKFVTGIVKKHADSSLPMYLFGHSMGGGISTCYLEKYPDDFSKAILSSPMLEMNSGNIPVWVAAVVARLAILTGKGQNAMPGAQPFSDKRDFEGSCTTCPERYDYWFEQQKKHPEYQMQVTTFRTALEFLKLTKYAGKQENCDRVKANILLMQAGNDTMVKPGGQEAFIRKIGDRGRISVYPEAKHEIYRCTDEIVQRYWNEITEFFAI